MRRLLPLLLAGCAPVLAQAPAADPLLASRSAAELMSEAESLWSRRPDLAAVRQSERNLQEALLRPGTAPQAAPALIRGAGWLIEHGALADERSRLVDAAERAGQACQQQAPATPACDYWQAVGMGIKAREHPTEALDSLKQMAELLRRAGAADSKLDESGPARVLALMLLRAPGWPLGPGDPEEGLTLARTAVERSPEHPMNHLVLAEALAANADPDGARTEYQKAAELSAKRLAQGDPDASDWAAQADAALGK